MEAMTLDTWLILALLGFGIFFGLAMDTFAQEHRVGRHGNSPKS